MTEFDEDNTKYVMLISSSDNLEISKKLSEDAKKELDKHGFEYQEVTVPSIFEIPTAIEYAVRGHEFFSARRRFDGYIVLGCIIEQADNMIYSSTISNLQGLMIKNSLALGKGIFCSNSNDTAIKLANEGQLNYGADAVNSCVEMMELKQKFGLKR